MPPPVSGRQRPTTSRRRPSWWPFGIARNTGCPHTETAVRFALIAHSAIYAIGGMGRWRMPCPGGVLMGLYLAFLLHGKLTFGETRRRVKVIGRLTEFPRPTIRRWHSPPRPPKIPPTAPTSWGQLHRSENATHKVIVGLHVPQSTGPSAPAMRRTQEVTQ